MHNQIHKRTDTGRRQYRPKVLIFISYYYPGYKAGGALRSIVNLVSELGDEFEFLIVTSDRDWTDKKSYEGIAVDAWNQVGNAKVFYLSPQSQSFLFISKLLSETVYDVLYLNSFFDRVFTQIPLWSRKLRFAPIKPLIIAPRGEFSNGAFLIKSIKKSIYTSITLKLGLFKMVRWHASTKYEAHDIHSHIKHKYFEGSMMEMEIAPDISQPMKPYVDLGENIYPKYSEVLRVVFISRISQKKNLDFALRVLGRAKISLEFSIYGPNDGDLYWEKCRDLIDKLPANIAVNYHGEVSHEKVPEILRNHDLFFFPTMGENYGHVIMESFSAGTPVLISDATPWRNLEALGIGWDLPLEDEKAFLDKIYIAADQNAGSRDAWRHKTCLYATNWIASADAVGKNRKMFNRLL